jgi:hypothetical protein
MVDISCTTSHEINSTYFVVERSRNGKDFTPVDFLAGQGSSCEVKTY